MGNCLSESRIIFGLWRLLADKTAIRHFRFTTKSWKIAITQKRYAMEGKILLITNRKSVIAFQDPGLYFTCDATWRRNRPFVTSVLRQNREKSLITQKHYEMERKLILITNRKSVIVFLNPGLYVACNATWRRNSISSLPFYDKIVKSRLQPRNGARWNES